MIVHSEQRRGRPRGRFQAVRAEATASDLTFRELEVAQFIALGLSNRQIAERLVIGQRTAETHVAHLLSKLAVASRAQIAVWVTEHREAIGRMSGA